MKTLADLTGTTGRTVDVHLILDLIIPVHAGLQAQGDLVVVPLDDLAGGVRAAADATWVEVPPEGIEVVRGTAAGNAHTLVADPGTCVWSADALDPTGLAIGMFEAMAPVYLLHREHGGTGVAPGCFVVRRQREYVPPVPAVRQNPHSGGHRTVPRALEPGRADLRHVRLVAD